MIEKVEKIEMSIWQRDFSLPVVYECYGEDVETEQQIDAINNFVAHKDWVENSKTKVEQFCKNDVMADDDNTKKDNIFSYIKPHYLFVSREKVNVKVALMCMYRYNEEGIAIVFESDGSVSVGIQDVIL